MRVSDVCRFLAAVSGFLGFIGDFFLANIAGKTIEVTDYSVKVGRNWGTTIGVFIGVAIGIAIECTILIVLAEIYDMILFGPRYKSMVPMAMPVAPVATPPAYSGNTTVSNGRANLLNSRNINSGYWFCECGYKNRADALSCEGCFTKRRNM